jgi:hypothetical protein
MLQARIAAAFPFSSLAIRCRNRPCWLVGPIDPCAGAGLRASPRGLTIAPYLAFVTSLKTPSILSILRS